MTSESSSEDTIEQALLGTVERSPAGEVERAAAEAGAEAGGMTGVIDGWWKDRKRRSFACAKAGRAVCPIARITGDQRPCVFFSTGP